METLPMSEASCASCGELVILPIIEDIEVADASNVFLAEDAGCSSL